MPVQTQMSSFAKKMGAQIAAANQEHKDKPIDTGMRQLPGGIKNGIAKLKTMYTKEYADDKSGEGMKGQTFFRASAIIMSPESVSTSHGAEKVAGRVTSVMVPLCATPAKGQKKATTFSENWYEFQNIFKIFGINPPAETPQSDPDGTRTEAYYFAAMRALCDEKRPPSYVMFSTRGWTPPATLAQPKPTEMVFETWHEKAQWDGKHDPAAGVVESTQPSANTLPPGTNAKPPMHPSEPPAQPQTAAQQGAAPPPTTGQQPQYQPGGDPDPADVVAALVEIAMNDPDGATEEGSEAANKLVEMAVAVGHTLEAAHAAADWTQVGDMALNPPTTPATAPASVAPTPTPTVGSKWKFAKRTKDGAKLKNAKGEEFPPQEVEVTTVDATAKTCTVKTIKDGKDVVDIRSKKPVAVKFEWLETIAY